MCGTAMYSTDTYDTAMHGTHGTVTCGTVVQQQHRYAVRMWAITHLHLRPSPASGHRQTPHQFIHQPRLTHASPPTYPAAQRQSSARSVALYYPLQPCHSYWQARKCNTALHNDRAFVTAKNES